jgi:hypothetical protein
MMALDKEYSYAKYHLCLVSFMLSVANKPFVLSVIRLSVIRLSVLLLRVILLSVILLCVILQSVILLSVVSPAYIFSVLDRIGKLGCSTNIKVSYRVFTCCLPFGSPEVNVIKLFSSSLTAIS